MKVSIDTLRAIAAVNAMHGILANEQRWRDMERLLDEPGSGYSTVKEVVAQEAVGYANALVEALETNLRRLHDGQAVAGGDR